MTSEHQQWQKLKNNYLKQIEQALASIDHPKNTDVLCDVDEHLERKFGELAPEQQNWESYHRILVEMGPPEEYAELLTEEKTPVIKSIFGINGFLAVVFVIVLMLVGAYTIHTAKNTPPATRTSRDMEFELDERILDQWTSVDFAKTIEEFVPYNKKQQKKLFLSGLDFQPDGIVFFSFETGQSAPNRWSCGEIYYADERPSRYELKTINGEQYLFVEWISGDVIIRGQEPYYYVLRKEE